MGTFERAFALVVGEEGGYEANPADPGNWTGGAVGSGILRGTKFGISAAAYPWLDIARLSIEDARAIYRRDYWERIAGDSLPPALATFMFSAAVNQGPHWACRMLQDAVGVNTDGVIGPKTLAAIVAYPLDDLLQEVAWRRECRYRQDPQFAADGHGWIRRLARDLLAAGGLLSPATAS